MEGDAYFDLIGGVEMRVAVRDGRAMLAGRLRPRGIGAFLAGRPQRLGAGFKQFLAAQARGDAGASVDSAFPEKKTQLRVSGSTRRLSRVPDGMVRIDGGSHRMRTQFRMREAGYYESTHPHLAGGGTPALHKPHAFERDVVLRPYAIDLTPVTNALYAEFLRRSGYRPRHKENFLRHWRNGAPAAGREEHPVVWVDLDDARAYAVWAGKRLPTEEEWQFAAQGPDGRLWPWGNEMRPDCCNAGQTGGTTPVRAFPNGRSPFGVYDMCGNTWEWTESERSDGRTRFAIIRGGSWFEAKGSAWYMDGGPRPADFGAKFLLMWPGLDRCGTIGFRCAADLE